MERSQSSYTAMTEFTPTPFQNDRPSARFLFLENDAMITMIEGRSALNRAQFFVNLGAFTDV